MAVFAPMPRASVSIATTVKAGDLAKTRRPYRKSCHRVIMLMQHLAEDARCPGQCPGRVPTDCCMLNETWLKIVSNPRPRVSASYELRSTGRNRANQRLYGVASVFSRWI